MKKNGFRSGIYYFLMIQNRIIHGMIGLRNDRPHYGPQLSSQININDVLFRLDSSVSQHLAQESSVQSIDIFWHYRRYRSALEDAFRDSIADSSAPRLQSLAAERPTGAREAQMVDYAQIYEHLDLTGALDSLLIPPLSEQAIGDAQDEPTPTTQEGVVFKFYPTFDLDHVIIGVNEDCLEMADPDPDTTEMPTLITAVNADGLAPEQEVDFDLNQGFEFISFGEEISAWEDVNANKSSTEILVEQNPEVLADWDVSRRHTAQEGILDIAQILEAELQKSNAEDRFASKTRKTKERTFMWDMYE
ncbi:hypothetical protein BP5796_00869 [Coleophoma crateriformis]|uniref:Uncharacterized protein n=1 Tax=Coleophoma crateriformis TaxID=565419 RepID=A0A3D8T991_9HELO|nr:hypothetical protein BP5796_00869 [Coleophoma crateriformis]